MKMIFYHYIKNVIVINKYDLYSLSSLRKVVNVLLRM